MDDHPQRIGPYDIVELIGEGGTGKVYLAEQTEPLRRTVAIKVLEAVQGSERVLVRFEVERLALAVMDHPSIAKVYDAGIFDGHPYVVMELVEGTPIGQYCDDRRLTVRQRVELFTEACRAVHHAHQKGVLHRDLKPSHLLVTEIDGRPRLRIIDFGIAIALERESHLDVGRDESEVVGTPGYMSPEQMEGSADVDTRSDIYSLGVILYELLVGVSPFDTGRRRGWAAVAAQLEDLPTPTRRLVSLDDTQDTLASHRGTTPRGLRRALHGDLDSIVSRAMSKDRTDRYETARDLWLDLDRYLSFEPVEARAGAGIVYWAGKFARRHTVGVGVGAVLVSAAIVVGVNAAVQADRVARARDIAEARTAQAERLIDFMLTDLRDRLQPLGRLDVLDAVGEQAEDYFETLPEGEIGDDDLFRRVRALQLIGQVRLDQGNLAAAREAFDRALELNLGLVERDPDNAEWQVALGASHFYVGFIDYRLGHPEPALSHMRTYLAVAEGLVARDATNPEWLTELAYAHGNIGSVLEEQHDLEAALAEHMAARDALGRLVEQDPSNGTLQLDYADRYNTVGYVLQALGRLDEALVAFEEEMRLKEALVARDTANMQWKARLATGHNYLGQSLETLGRRDAASDHYRAAVSLWTQLVERDTTNTRWRRNLWMNQERMASVLETEGALERALALLLDVERARRALSVADPSDSALRQDEASAYVSMASVLLRLGRTREARARAQSAQAILEELAQRSAPSDADLVRSLAMTQNVLGRIQASAGDADAADRAWARSAELLEPIASGSSDPRTVAPWVEALLRLERVDAAESGLRRLERAGYKDVELARLAAGRGIETSLFPE